jgi:hypothetical protein
VGDGVHVCGDLGLLCEATLGFCRVRSRILQEIGDAEIAEITLKNRLRRAAFGGRGHTATRREAIDASYAGD